MVRLMTRTLEPAHCHSHCALGPAHLYFGIRNLCRALAIRAGAEPSVDEISQFERIETVLIAVFLQVLPVMS